MTNWIHRLWLTLDDMPICSLMAIGALILGAAHLSQHGFGLAPCALCLLQREAIWLALWAGLLGLAASRIVHRPWLKSAALGLMAASFAYGVYLAAWHSGVEFGWFPAPPLCTGGGLDLSSPDALLSDIGGRQIISCADAPFRLLGFSMANINLVLMSSLSGLAGWLAFQARPPR
jgi:disulfide bond formation protein DsbB